uniref:Uncharacterized protein n=1 Tax=Parascaris univalens TaxID=6257 RepID=A0A915BFF2_PARUN
MRTKRECDRLTERNDDIRKSILLQRERIADGDSPLDYNEHHPHAYYHRRHKSLQITHSKKSKNLTSTRK